MASRRSLFINRRGTEGAEMKERDGIATSPAKRDPHNDNKCVGQGGGVSFFVWIPPRKGGEEMIPHAAE